jgi:hypothetical protein
MTPSPNGATDTAPVWRKRFAQYQPIEYCDADAIEISAVQELPGWQCWSGLANVNRQFRVDQQPIRFAFGSAG